jgi:hypothetical protein
MRSFEGTPYGLIDARPFGPKRAQGAGDGVTRAAISMHGEPRE